MTNGSLILVETTSLTISENTPASRVRTSRGKSQAERSDALFVEFDLYVLQQPLMMIAG